MFKSKTSTNYPIQPSPPTWEEMENDLSAASTSDILFNLRPRRQQDSEPVTDSSTSEMKPSNEDQFTKAVEFYTSYHDLQHQMKLLKDQRDKLHNISCDLQDSVKKVKSQAQNALCESSSG